MTINITSDEELRRLPLVYFGEIVDVEDDDDAEEADLQLDSIRRGDRVQSDATAENTWSRTYDNSDVGGRSGLYAVVVVAEDDADNVGTTPGWERERQTKVPEGGIDADLDDLTDGGLLLEVDTGTVEEADFSLSPEAGEDESESGNPFITIDFGGEAKEYASSGNSRFKSDSHSAVEIVSITLNGNDVSDRVADVENNKYTLCRAGTSRSASTN